MMLSAALGAVLTGAPDAPASAQRFRSVVEVRPDGRGGTAIEQWTSCRGCRVYRRHHAGGHVRHRPPDYSQHVPNYGLPIYQPPVYQPPVYQAPWGYRPIYRSHPRHLRRADVRPPLAMPVNPWRQAPGPYVISTRATPAMLPPRPFYPGAAEPRVITLPEMAPPAEPARPRGR